MGGSDMLRLAFAAVLLSVAFSRAGYAAEGALTDQQVLGQRLFETSCGICHTRPTLLAGMYGPELNKDTAGGREDVIRDVITNGTPRMPGFKYTYNADQIAAIAAYVKTLPPGNQAMTVPPPAR